MALGENIKRIRELRELSVEELAEKMGIGKAGIYKWESNETKPGLDSLTDLSKALDVTIDELVNEKPTLVQESTVNTENESKEEVYRKLVEANTAYRLVPKTILDEEYRIILKSELEEKAQMWRETLAAKNNLIDQLHKEIADLRATLSSKPVHAQQT